MPTIQDQQCRLKILGYNFEFLEIEDRAVSIPLDRTVADLQAAIASNNPDLDSGLHIYALKDPKLGLELCKDWPINARTHLRIPKAKAKISEVWPEEHQLQDITEWGHQCFIVLPDRRTALPPSKDSLSKYSLTKVSDSQTFHDVDLSDNFVYPDGNTFPPPPSIAGIDKALSSPLEVYDPLRQLQRLLSESPASCNIKVLTAPGEHPVLHDHIIHHLCAASASWTVPGIGLEMAYASVYFTPLARNVHSVIQDTSFTFIFNHQCPARMLAYNRFKKEYLEYKPRNDFAIWYHGSPRLLVEIQSDNLQPDETRLLAVAAVLLRMARANHRKDTDLAKFVIVAVYMTRAHVARRFLVYLDRDEYDVPTVLYTRKEFSLNVTEQRLSFICELYQLVEYIRAHPCSELNIPQSDVGRQIAMVVNNLPSLTTPSTQRKQTRTETDPSTSRALSTSQMQVDDLEAIGFVPVGEADGDELRPFDHLPRHVHLVRRAERGEIFVLKQTRAHELEILKFIRDFQPSCRNIIPLLETVELSTGPCAVLPRRQLIANALSFPAAHIQLHGRFLQFAEDLIHGMTFIHDLCIAHLDIKPENLVYTDEGGLHLEIIDFDISVQLSHPDEVIDTYCGTERYRAPEIGFEDGPRRPYSPIRADRFSAGRVLFRFAEVHGKEDQCLAQFARRLLNKDPAKRPLLSEWFQFRKGLVGSKRPFEEAFGNELQAC
ncbi:hypothetical protein BC629DRAFT_1724205 [Irpex lacteus]|nr:hypothetical protein BC629DRAFT_1724205 [Irpex lacteus]